MGPNETAALEGRLSHRPKAIKRKSLTCEGNEKGGPSNGRRRPKSKRNRSVSPRRGADWAASSSRRSTQWKCVRTRRWPFNYGVRLFYFLRRPTACQWESDVVRNGDVRPGRAAALPLFHRFPSAGCQKEIKKENIVGGGARADEMESGGAECGMRRRNFRIIDADFGDPTNRNCRHIFGISFLSADHLLPKWLRRRHFLEILRRPHSSLQCALVVRSRSIY